MVAKFEEQCDQVAADETEPARNENELVLRHALRFARRTFVPARIDGLLYRLVLSARGLILSVKAASATSSKHATTIALAPARVLAASVIRETTGRPTSARASAAARWSPGPDDGRAVERVCQGPSSLAHRAQG